MAPETWVRLRERIGPMEEPEGEEPVNALRCAQHAAAHAHLRALSCSVDVLGERPQHLGVGAGVEQA